MTQDEILIAHRFSSINENLISALIHSYLYFSSPKNVNDPYDCQINLEKSLEKARRKANDKQNRILNHYTNDLLNQINGIAESVGIACFSKQLNNSLMWSHYAKHHTGVALTYKIPSSFILENSLPLVGWEEVSYRNNIIKNFFLSLIHDPKENNFDNFIKPLITKIFTAKSAAWKYEKEFRIVKDSPGRFSIDKRYLKQICLGLNTSKEHIALIKEIISNHGYQHVTLVKMCRDNRHDFSFKPNEL